jgi:enamidase
MKVAVFSTAKILRGDITDIMGVGTVITGGVPRFVGRGRNTLETTRRAKVAHSRIAQLFTGEA